MKILVCNSGSSSLKFSLFEADHELLLAEGSIDWTTRPTRLVFRRPGQPEIREELHLREHSEALGRILADLQAGPSAPLHGISKTLTPSGTAWFTEAGGLPPRCGLRPRSRAPLVN